MPIPQVALRMNTKTQVYFKKESRRFRFLIGDTAYCYATAPFSDGRLLGRKSPSCSDVQKRLELRFIVLQSSAVGRVAPTLVRTAH